MHKNNIDNHVDSGHFGLIINLFTRSEAQKKKKRIPKEWRFVVVVVAPPILKITGTNDWIMNNNNDPFRRRKKKTKNQEKLFKWRKSIAFTLIRCRYMHKLFWRMLSTSTNGQDHSFSVFHCHVYTHISVLCWTKRRNFFIIFWTLTEFRMKNCWKKNHFKLNHFSHLRLTFRTPCDQFFYEC